MLENMQAHPHNFPRNCMLSSFMSNHSSHIYFLQSDYSMVICVSNRPFYDLRHKKYARAFGRQKRQCQPQLVTVQVDFGLIVDQKCHLVVLLDAKTGQLK